MTAKQTTTLDVDRTRARLVRLGLGFAAETLDRLLADAVKETTRPHAFLDHVLAGEIAGRKERRIARSLRLSTPPTGPTLANFDFAFQPAIERSRIQTLATSAWVRGAETVLLQGPPGVGKTHLAVGLGIKAIEQGFSVQFYRFDELLVQLRRDVHLPPSKLRRKKYLSTRICDAFGDRRVGLQANGPSRGKLVLPLGDVPLRPGGGADHDEQVGSWVDGAVGRR